MAMNQNAKYAIVALALIGAGALTQDMLRTVSENGAGATPSSLSAPASVDGPKAQGTPADTAAKAPPRRAPRRSIRFSIAGWPIGLFGLAWFLAVLAFELSGSDGAAAQRFRFHVFWSGLLALAFVVWLAMRVSFQLQLVGPRLVTAAACVLAVFVVTALSELAPARTAIAHLISDARLLLGRAPLWMAATAVTLMASQIAMGAHAGSAPAPARALPTGAAFEAWYSAQPRTPVPGTPEGAAVTIVKFNDYQCPPCRATHESYRPVIERLAREYPGAIRFVARDYPLETECNSYLAEDIHEAACEAAAAARVARERGRGAAMEEWLFEHQDAMSSEDVFAAARTVAGIEDLKQRYPALLEAIRADVAVGRQLRIGGTPAHFVNGVQLPPVSPEDLETAILHELRVAGRLRPAASE
jgi:protein-disulfide isomerase